MWRGVTRTYEELEGEETACRALKTAHEVDDNVVDGDPEERKRHVGQRVRENSRSRSIEAITRLQP